MSKRLDKDSRDILEFRPNIEFVEPEVTSVVPTPIPQPLQIEGIQKEVDQTVALAKAVDTLAAAVQARADLRASGMVIALDPGIDAAAISSMRRLYPDDNPNEINYDQYRNCKDQQRDHGIETAKKAAISADDINKARKDLDNADDVQKTNLSQIGGFGSPEAANGGLRPELNKNAQIVPPLDMEETQDLLIKLFVNFLWENFIRPIIPLPFLPKKIAKVPKNTRAEQFIGAAEDSVKKIPKVQIDSLTEATLESVRSSQAPDLTGIAAREPKVSEPFKFQDCQNLTKTFERAAHFCTTEESVFAMMTPTLNGMRTNANAFLIQAQANQIMVDRESGMKGQGEAEEDAEAYKKKDWFADWIKDCIPCLDRIDFGELGFGKIWEEIYEQLLFIKDQYLNQLKQLANMLKFWDFEESYIDLCALKDFFTKFVCIPDLAKLIAAFMALLMKLAFELTNLFDIILGLIAPLITPFLSVIINTVTQFLMLILKPLNCLIDSMIAFLEKADWSQLFQGGAAFNVQFGTEGPGVHVAASKIPLPFTNKRLPDLDLKVPRAEFNIHEEVSPYLGIPGTEFTVSAQKKKEQQDVDDANAALAKIRKKLGDVDMRDDKQRKQYYDELEKARAELNEAVSEQSFSEAQQRAQELRELKQMVRSLFQKIIQYVREIIEAIETFFVELVDEFKKLMGDIFGTNNMISIKLFKKLEIIKLISIIIAIVVALSKGLDCDDLANEVEVHSLVPQRQGFTVLTDEFGNINIIEDSDAVKGAIDDVVASLEAGQSAGQPAGTRQNLKSLIEFTGDPVLDSEIARLADAVETPVSVTFKCPLVTSVADAEKVNTWIRELNTV